MYRLAENLNFCNLSDAYLKLKIDSPILQNFKTIKLARSLRVSVNQSALGRTGLFCTVNDWIIFIFFRLIISWNLLFCFMF